MNTLSIALLRCRLAIGTVKARRKAAAQLWGRTFRGRTARDKRLRSSLGTLIANRDPEIGAWGLIAAIESKSLAVGANELRIIGNALQALRLDCNCGCNVPPDPLSPDRVPWDIHRWLFFRLTGLALEARAAERIEVLCQCFPKISAALPPRRHDPNLRAYEHDTLSGILSVLSRVDLPSALESLENYFTDRLTRFGEIDEGDFLAVSPHLRIGTLYDALVTSDRMPPDFVVRFIKSSGDIRCYRFFIDQIEKAVRRVSAAARCSDIGSWGDPVEPCKCALVDMFGQMRR